MQILKVSTMSLRLKVECSWCCYLGKECCVLGSKESGVQDILSHMRSLRKLDLLPINSLYRWSSRFMIFFMCLYVKV